MRISGTFRQCHACAQPLGSSYPEGTTWTFERIPFGAGYVTAHAVDCPHKYVPMLDLSVLDEHDDDDGEQGR